MDLLQYLVLFLAAAAAGAVNSVAGGGTLLTFPSLLWVLGNSVAANATSTVALWPGSLSSFWGYRSELQSSRREILMLFVPSFLGGTLGAVLLLGTKPEVFDFLVPWLILSATLLFVAQEPLSRWQRQRCRCRVGQAERSPTNGSADGNGVGGTALGLSHPTAMSHPSATASRARWAAVLGFQFLVGVYGGYFGAGIGILMLAAFGLLGFTNIHHMNGLKNLNNMCINGIAAALFIAKGLVDWRLALLMAVGAIFGGYAGAGTARRIGQKNVRRLIIGIGFALTAWLIVRQI